MLIGSDRLTPVIALADLLGVLLLFNLGHWWVTGAFAEGLLLSWKLIAIAALTFLSNYLLDTFTFESHLSRLGLVERTAIAMGLAGTAIALLVYAMGPEFIGGFVGRGVVGTSLFAVWLWSLALRILLTRLLTGQQIDQWLVVDASPSGSDAAVQLASHFRRRAEDPPLALLSDSEQAPPPGARINRVGGLADYSTAVAAQNVAGVIVIATEMLDDSLINKLLQTRISGT